LDGVSKHNYTGYTGKVINVNTNYVILGGGSYLNGSLDDIRIYNRDLSSTEMNTLYSDPDTFLTEGLVGHWKFDEAHGTTFGDYENQYYWVWLNLDGCTGGQFFEPPFNFDSCCSDCVSCWDG